MYFLRNRADWDKWRYVFDRHENCPVPKSFPCHAYISADGDGREAQYLYTPDLWEMLGAVGLANEQRAPIKS